MVFGETGTCCLFSRIYPRSLPIRLAFSRCERAMDQMDDERDRKLEPITFNSQRLLV